MFIKNSLYFLAISCSLNTLSSAQALKSVTVQELENGWNNNKTLVKNNKVYTIKNIDRNKYTEYSAPNFMGDWTQSNPHLERLGRGIYTVNAMSYMNLYDPELMHIGQAPAMIYILLMKQEAPTQVSTQNVSCNPTKMEQ